METATRRALPAFYAGCNAAHREFFAALMRDWCEAGLPLTATIDGVSLEVRSTTRDAERGRPGVFVLLAGRGREGARIELDVARWRQWTGEEETDAAVRMLTGIEGLVVQQDRARLRIIEPGHASGPTQADLRAALVRVGRRMSDRMGL